MQQKRKSPRKNTYPHLVSGPAPGFPNGVHEWTNAVNERQALKQVALLLEKQYPHMVIYLGDCTVTKGARRRSAS